MPENGSWPIRCSLAAIVAGALASAPESASAQVRGVPADQRAACRYDFRSAPGVMSLETTLKGLVRDKQTAEATCEYLPSGAL